MNPLQLRAEEIAATIKLLAPVGTDWMIIAWDGSGDVGTVSSVPHDRIVEVLRQLRGGELDVTREEVVDDDDDFDEECSCDHCERIRERLADEREIADALACCADERDHADQRRAASRIVDAPDELAEYFEYVDQLDGDGGEPW